ncbi:PKD domain-containing protein [Propionibacteriaceae bacterium G57]|uniref:PKD domain-containing protein n=1 Tax=Aestuariimicrobium sp. G57 TaxID=3418485 RepID=UPI003DA762A2
MTTLFAVTALMTTTFLSTAHAVTSATGTIPVTLTDTASLGSVTKTATSGDFSGSVTLSASTTWSESGSLIVGWDPDNVRQGRHLDPGYSFDPTSGHLSMTYSATLTGTANVSGNDVSISFTASVPMSGTCTPDSSGHYGTCTISSASLDVFQPVPDSVVGSLAPLSPKVSLKLTSQVAITDLLSPTANRAATSGGTAVAPNAVLAPSESTQTDPLTVSCRVGAGDTLTYAMTDLAAQRTLTFNTSVQLNIDVSSPVPIPLVPYPDFPYINVYSESFPVDARAGSVSLNHAGGSIDMGVLQANNIAPVVTTTALYSGNEGSGIAFAASATGPCAAGGSFVWRFSDGTTQYGPTPTKVFTDSGAYTGSVTFTDVTGLSDTQSFTVSVGNRAPNLSVTPTNATLAWGRPLTLQAQAVDPGAGDQATLTYAWTFGDGTVISSGGASVTHQWAVPGDYTVGLTVCDKDGGCTSANIPVTVTKRATTTSYTGDTTGTYSAHVTLSGSVVDEFGNPVNGAQVDFTLDGSPAGQALTGAGGSASVTVVAPQAGDHPVVAGYAGSTLYEASTSATQSLHVNTMATVLTYTGAVTGKPKKAAPVSVTLVDALGRPIANQSVVVTIGAQQTTVTTNAQGVATGQIVLNQKPGTYPITADWGGVAGTYRAASAAGVFKLNTK